MRGIEHILVGHSTPVTSVAIPHDGRHIISGLKDKSVCIWNAVTGEIDWVLDRHSDWVTSVAISHDGTHVVSGVGANMLINPNMLIGIYA